jgi:hypothetical protein
MVLRLWWEPIIGPPRVWTISSHARRQQIGLSPSLDMQPVSNILRVHSSIVTAPHARYKPRLGHQQGIRRLRVKCVCRTPSNAANNGRATAGKREAFHGSIARRAASALRRSQFQTRSDRIPRSHARYPPASNRREPADVKNTDISRRVPPVRTPFQPPFRHQIHVNLAQSMTVGESRILVHPAPELLSSPI